MMKSKWIVPSALVLLSLALVFLLSQIASQALVPAADLEVTKSVSPWAIAPGEPVIYEVVLNNTTGSALEVSSLVDTLPPDFEYVGLAPGSEWAEEPWDTTPPEIQWSGPIPVPTSGLILRYNVSVPGSVPLSPEPYTNTVVADVGGTLYQGEAGLLVAVGEVTVDKSAVGRRVEPGQVATYTVTFNNSGYVSRTLDMVYDVLPAGVTFKRMTGASDGWDDPVGSGTIVWAGNPFPIDIAPQTGVVVEYEVTMPVVTDTLVNEAAGYVEGEFVGPASVEVVVGYTSWFYFPLAARRHAPPGFSVSKTADPSYIFDNDSDTLFTYTAAFYNYGTVEGVLAEVRDTLPAGFTFEEMVTETSDVDFTPTGTTGEIVWTGPFTVAGETSLELVYRVRPQLVVGTYLNSATATTVPGKGRPPDTPGRATVHISEPIYLEEGWEAPSPYWQPFLNYWRLKWGQWYVSPGGGVGGSAALRHTATNGGEEAHDALYMYLNPAAEEWADYRLQAKIRLNDRKRFQGLWFRGGYEDSEENLRHVEGYLLCWRMGEIVEDNVWLARIPADGEWANRLSDPETLIVGDYPFNLGAWYDVRVDVVGSHIEVYIDNNFVFEWDDDTWPTGTVGAWSFKVLDGAWDDILVTPLQ